MDARRRRTRLGLLLLGGALLLLGHGCRPAAPPLAAEDGGAPPPAAAGLADAGTTPPSPPVAEDAGRPLPGPIQPGAGIGPVRLGMARAELERHLGPPAGQRTIPLQDVVVLLFQNQSISCTLGPDNRLQQLTVWAAAGDPFFLQDGSARTVEGLGVVSLPAEFRQAWGPAPEQEPASSPFYEEGARWRYPRRGVELLLATPSAGGGPVVVGVRVLPPRIP